ncbi:hypothetical protein DM02DRAFT_666829 [Periconia macrospinosa]|uniref:Lytic polysaccharide monooxygenase n=1 Tax=Periconia macrospinosa TaxID=97972 RepID=A0A2V1EBM2_9PLEO|nr:hypothetical protein DM02DRAFT_666829 [Periconia macrospinosa]
MFGLLPLLTVVTLHLASGTWAQYSKITPCAKGSGNESNGCSQCSSDKAIEVTPWENATYVKDFHLEKAASRNGGGYNVWWSVEQPAEGCRILLFDPFNSDKGNLNSGVPGNIVLSTAHSGCYTAHVGSRGISAGACCWDDCRVIGAVPDTVAPKTERKKREAKPQFNVLKVLNEATAKCEEYWALMGDKANTCSEPKASGFTYTKSGKQQTDGAILKCDHQGCSITPSITMSASTTITNEKTVEEHQGTSVSVGVEVGASFLIGPSISTSTEINHEWSKTVTETMSRSDTSAVSKTVELQFDLTLGNDYNAWFTPLLRCQAYKLQCSGPPDFKRKSKKNIRCTEPMKFEMQIEMCDPILTEAGQPAGEHGVMTVG